MISYDRYHNGHGKFFQMLCLANLILIPLIGEAKETKNVEKNHSLRKVDTTPNTNNDDVWTFAIESNIYSQTSYLNPILEFSSNDNWDIQLASYNIPVYGDTQSYQWNSYINLSKTLDINDLLQVIVGSQNGITSHKFYNINYGLLAYRPRPDINIHAGPYWANKASTATTDYIGYTLGFSKELINNKLTIQGDFFSGSHNVSGAVINLNYQFFTKTQVYIGAGIPTPNSGNQFYGIIGFILSLK